jgi:outer membrane protein OmpA-like peptidoglycan-associated protein
MRKSTRLIVTVLAVTPALVWLGTGPALAQATYDPGALDALGGGAASAPAHSGAAKARPQPKPARKATAAHPHGPHQSLPPSSGSLAAPGKPATPAPATLPAAPPPAPVLPPPITVPMRAAEMPPPPAVVPNATGAATREGGGLRVTFGTGSSDLNPATEAAVRALATDPPPPPGSTFAVTSYAAPTPDDPSTARRLSLSRALAVRSVLMHAGIPSPRIYVRALGGAPAEADAPPDRVDIALTPPPAPSTVPASAPAVPQTNQKAAP